jgi:hypothetical protein
MILQGKELCKRVPTPRHKQARKMEKKSAFCSLLKELLEAKNF